MLQKMKWLQVTKVVQPPPRDGKKREYAFVHFADHSVVEQLISNSERGVKPTLDGNALEVTHLLPCSKSRPLP